MAQQPHSLAGRRVWARRQRRAASLLVAIAATVFVVAFCVSGIVGYGARSSLAGIRSSLSTTGASVVLKAPLASNPKAQDAGVRAVIAREFGGAPLLVTRALATSGAPAARWTIAPNSQTVTPGDLGKLETGFAGIEAAVTKSKAARSPAVGITGHGAKTVQSTVRAVGALNGVELIPLTVLSLAGLIALALARSLLTDYRRNETRFLRSRGSTGGFLTRLDVRESVLTCLVGTALGCAAAQAALWFLVGRPTSVAEVVVPAAIVFVVAIAVNAVLAGTAARAAAGTPRPDSGRLRAAAPLTLCGFGVAIAVIAYWRFEQSATNGASFAADPSAILAPGAVLCAIALLCLLLAGRVTAGLENGLARTTGTRVFPVRSVNRSITIVAGPTALLALAIGIATITSAYSGTWQRFSADSQQLTTGGDLRASVVTEPVLTDATNLVPIDQYASVPGVSTASIASREDDTFGDASVTTLAAVPADLPKLLSPASTAIDARALAADLRSADTVGIALPAHSTAVTLSIAATATLVPNGSDATVQTTLWIADARGDLFPLTLKAQPITASGAAPGSVTGALPDRSEPWVIEAIDAGIVTANTLTQVQYSVAAISATVGGSQQPVSLAGQTWTPKDAVFGNGASEAMPSVGFGRSTIPGNTIGNVPVRIMPKASTTVPVVLSAPFAAASGLLVGSKLSVDGQWASYTGVVKAILPAVPGTTTGQSLIAGLPALNRGRLATSEQIPTSNEVWMSSRTPEHAAIGIASRLPSATVVLASDTSGDSIVSGATTALWIGAIGTSVFAIIALIAAVVALLRRRSTETFALRALGLRASKQAGLRRQELGILGLIALIIGAIAGAAVSLLIATTMAQLSTPTAPAGLTVRLEFDPLPVTATLCLLLVAFLACWIGYGAAEQRRATRSSS